LELVCSANVEHEIPIEDGDDIVGEDVFSKEFGMSWRSASVASDEDVVSFFGGDETKTIDVRI